MKTKIVSLAMAILLMVTLNIPAFASTAPAKSSGGSGIHVMFTNTDDATANVNFSGDCADCSSIIHAKTGTTKITITGLLKRVNSNGTTTVKSWTASAAGDTLYFEKSYYVASGYTYQFQIIAKVYRNGTVENVSVTDSAYCG